VDAAEAENVNESPPSPIYQPTVSFNERRLPVGQFNENRADLALYASMVQHDLTQASVADLLKLSTCAAKYRTPYLMERFIEASVNLETRTVDCCRNGCLAFTDKRVQALFSYIHCHLFTLSGATYASICRLADPQQSYESSTPTWRIEYDWQDLQGSRREKSPICD